MANRNLFVRSVLVVVLVALLSSCGPRTDGSSFTLAGGEVVSGHLLILSKNATLEKGSTVEGSVFMICCNLKVEGEVRRDVFLLTGNLWVDRDASVSGSTKVVSGNLAR